jgi:hypothetical protein
MADEHGTGEVTPDERLVRWFAGEVERAEHDAATRPRVPLRGPSARRSWRTPALLTTGIAATLLVIAVIGPTLVPAQLTPRASASGAPSTGVASPAWSEPGASAVAGLPTTLDGRPVLDPLAALRTLHARADATTFLVGGWWQDAPPISCPWTPTIETHWLVQRCGLAGLSLRPEGAAILGVVSRADANPVPGGLVVLRVHLHDADAVTCSARLRATCEVAVVLEAVEWQLPRSADGIPSEWEGEPVLRPTDAIAVLASRVDDTSVLVGGWSSGPIVASCAVSPSPRHPLALRCGGSTAIAETRGRVIGLSVRTVAIPAGPVVIRVHVHDADAVTCPADLRAECEAAVVLEAIEWAGPPD